MKYEGKIYGKVGGKYIELDYPKDLKEFAKRLNEELDEKIANALFAAGDFQVRQMPNSFLVAESMANAYRDAKRMINGLHSEQLVSQTPTQTQ